MLCCVLQVLGFVLVCGLLLASLSIGTALIVARQKADANISLKRALLGERMLSVRSAAATLASDLGLPPEEAAQLGSDDGSLCSELLGEVCSSGLSGGLLSVQLAYGQLLEVQDTRTQQRAAAAMSSQVRSLGPRPLAPLLWCGVHCEVLCFWA